MMNTHAKKTHIKAHGAPRSVAERMASRGVHENAKKALGATLGEQHAQKLEDHNARKTANSVLRTKNQDAKLVRKIEANKVRDARRALRGGSPGVFSPN